MLNIESSGLKHATCAFISVIATTQQGVDYFSQYGLHIVKKVIEIVKTKQDDCTDGSVTQRFCLAILQKMSTKDEICVCLYEEGFLQWVCGLIERSIKTSTKAPIHSFCLDFGSALLANCLHSYLVLEKLEKNQRLLGDLLLRLL